MQLNQNISLEMLMFAAKSNPGIKSALDLLLVSNYDDFIIGLNRDLDSCINIMEEDPKIRREDGEDRLTSEIVLALRFKGYQVEHDAMVGGHCDIVVRYGNYTWLGEAKIHGAYDYLFQGFQQLCTRYASGTPMSNHGGLLIYIRNNDALAVVNSWRTHLSGKSLKDYHESECEMRPLLAFNSSHKHERSGLPYYVRHVGIVLGFDPKDKK